MPTTSEARWRSFRRELTSTSPSPHIRFRRRWPAPAATRISSASRHGSSQRRSASASWELVYQSRSGPTHIRWLEPDILDHLREVAARGVTDVVILPIGFVSDHLEVLFDLDIEARETAADCGLNLVRAASASTHPAFVTMVRELIEERLDPGTARPAVGRFAASHDVCPVDCCLPGTGRPSPWASLASG